jgi:hypothetical protein
MTAVEAHQHLNSAVFFEHGPTEKRDVDSLKHSEQKSVRKQRAKGFRKRKANHGRSPAKDARAHEDFGGDANNQKGREAAADNELSPIARRGDQRVLISHEVLCHGSVKERQRVRGNDTQPQFVDQSLHRNRHKTYRGSGESRPSTAAAG